MLSLIGDVHGKFHRYKEIIKEHPDTIQVGDMGVGFRRWPHGDQWLANPPYDHMVESNARFIRGNHDNPEVCRKHSQWIPDGHFENGVMFIGGANSIDQAYRVEGYSWWADEQCSYQELDGFIEKAMTLKPHTMVTHDAPQDIVHRVFSSAYLHKDIVQTRTQQALERIRQLVKPKLWVFGHWHTSADVTIDGTRFVCLAELEYKEFET